VKYWSCSWKLLLISLSLIVKKADLEIERLSDIVFDHKKCFFKRDDYGPVIGRIEVCRDWRYKPDSIPLEKTISTNYGDIISLKVLKDGSGIVSVYNDDSDGSHYIKIWNPTSKDLIRSIPGSRCFVSCMTIHQDGSLVVGYDNGLIKLWNPSTGDLIRTIQTGDLDMVRFLVVLQDGKIVSYSADSDEIRIWDHVTGDLVRTIRGKFGAISMIILSTSKE
jgi:WD40 repeat protein